MSQSIEKSCFCVHTRTISLTFCLSLKQTLKLSPSAYISIFFSLLSSNILLKISMEISSDEQSYDYFDAIPNDLLLLIFNNVLDAKSLVRCLSVSKRFASIVPLTDTVSLHLFPSSPSPRPRKPNNGFLVNYFKPVVNFIITKPLQLLRRQHRPLPPSSDSPCLCPHKLLHSFNHIKTLRLDLNTSSFSPKSNPGDGSPDHPFLKWKASFGGEFKTCVVLCATSFRRAESSSSSSPNTDDSTEQPEASSSQPLMPNEELKSRIMWMISCLIAASARHFLLKQTVLQFPMLKRVDITDSNKQGKFSMDEEDIVQLRDSLKGDDSGMGSLLTVERMVPDLRMKMWYVPELELPVSRCVLKGATLIVISPAGEVTAAATKGGGADSGFDGDEAEMAVYEEAESEIVKKKRSYVMEMTSF